MTDQEREELAAEMAAAMLHEDDFVKMARAALKEPGDEKTGI